jgi:putative DNA-invertase from lambdoid prophage Rac
MARKVVPSGPHVEASVSGPRLASTRRARGTTGPRKANTGEGFGERAVKAPRRSHVAPGSPRSPRNASQAVAGAHELTAAVYVRASTGRQDPANQGPDCARLAVARGLRIARTYTEWASAGGRRPVFEELVDDARRGAFGVVVVWALDRFGRSMVGNVRVLLELDRLGVKVVSVREPWLDTGGPVRDLLVSIFSWVAEQESRRLGERTRAGLDRARARGAHLGRPRRTITASELARARKLQKDGATLRFIAQRLRIPRATIARALQHGG